VIFVISFFSSSRKFSHLAIFLAWWFVSFSWLFWAAGGWINFLLEGDLNLKLPLNAFLNSRPD
jgi:hypothetical protein